jgi:RNA polymerase sigma-70 factor (ECF subfamily)
MRRATTQDLADAARRGDGPAFERLIEPHRDRLRARCRRILGSDHDADDALQDALVRAWRGLHGFERGGALGPWLNRIATNSSLDLLNRRRQVPVSGLDPTPVESRDLSASPAASYEQREDLELAVAAVIKHLPPRQRAALVLSDALGLSGREAAQALDTTTASVNSALQRARQNVGDRLPEPDAEPALRSIGDEQLRAEIERFTRAVERDDVGEIVGLLRD